MLLLLLPEALLLTDLVARFLGVVLHLPGDLFNLLDLPPLQLSTLFF